MIRKIAKGISRYGTFLWSMKHLMKRSGHAMIFPFYHAVTDKNPMHLKHLYAPRSIRDFKNDLDFLLKNYQSISLERVIELKKSGEAVPGNYFHLTFDDGLSEFYEVVAPILKEKKIHATVFLNSDFIDNKQLFFRFKASILFDQLKDNSILKVSYQDEQVLDELAKQNSIDFNVYLKEQQPYLTSEQIKSLITDGFTFGAHSKNHPLYKELSLAQQITQTKESVAVVSSSFGLDYQVFSFPFTDDGVSKYFFDVIAKETSLTFGCAGLKEDSAANHIQRIPMEGEFESLFKRRSKSGQQIIKEEYLYYLLKSKLGKNKIMRE
jgi:peptidoglycan/xylan/chitin deacetylase (PgdA/CDA1 family)